MRPGWIISFVAAVVSLGGCASRISPDRQDLAVVEGRIQTRGWDCGTVPREGGGYFYVCDMPIEVERVVLGQQAERSIVARYFVDVVDTEDAMYLGPNIRRDRLAAAILWRQDGRAASYVLMRFPGRWCVPDWMVAELGINGEETTRLHQAGYSLCSRADQPE